MRWIIGLIVGAGLGFLGYKLSSGSCTTNTCPLTSRPWILILLGAFMGATLFR
jgi:flagellar motor component MotA